jgi:GGDEF domain-containing protein
LTGLHNRAACNDLGRRMTGTAGGGTILLLDLDGFKPLNGDVPDTAARAG